MIPYLLALAGGYFIGNSFKKKEESFGDGGMMAKGGNIEEIWDEYQENEDNNYHSENVVLLAKHFGTKEDYAKAKEILRLHHDVGYLTSDLKKKRDELDAKLYPMLVKKHEEGQQKIVRTQFEEEEFDCGDGGDIMNKFKSGISGLASKSRDLAKAGYQKTKEGIGKAKEYTKKQIHDQKKKIALEVIDDTKDKVGNDNKKKLILKASEELVDKKYETGGGLKEEASGMMGTGGKLDAQRIAKPSGKRYTDKLAKKLGKSPYAKPTKKDVEKYSGKGVYTENRKDESDKKPSKRYKSL